MTKSPITIWIICKNTISVWLRNRSLIAASLLPPVAFLAAGFFAAAAVSHSPVALVSLDKGQQGIVMSKIIHSTDVFRVTDASPSKAQNLIKNVRVAAIITIPADFSQHVNHHQPAAINVEINNLNLDFTNDIRRSVPAAIVQYYKFQGSKSPIKVVVQESDLRHKDIQLFQYEVVPVLLLMVLIAGLVNTAVSTAREYEYKTIKEVLLSPVTDTEIVFGKILAGFLIGFFSGLLELGICLLFGWTYLPAAKFDPNVLLFISLTALLAASFGLVAGLAAKKIQAAHAVSVNLALPLFFVAGGVGVLAFEPKWLQNTASFVPLTYANHGLQMAMYYNSTNQIGRDSAILILVTLAAIVIALLLLRRSRSRLA
jgi:ABC-2 type transport system permease protein